MAHLSGFGGKVPQSTTLVPSGRKGEKGCFSITLFIVFLPLFYRILYKFAFKGPIARYVESGNFIGQKEFILRLIIANLHKILQ